MTSTGAVSTWSADDGWGVIESPDTPGGCWAHFACLDMPGYRSLAPGDVVEFEWEQPGQDGYPYRALHVRAGRTRSGDHTETKPSATTAYGSHLDLTLDDNK
jgi:CspA family cold shock protein